jgi:hypothetical protein
MMASDPWPIINALSLSKKPPEDLSGYNAYVINRAFSYYPDTLFLACELNRYSSLPVELQFDYYYFGVAPRKRYSKWIKKEKVEDENIAILMRYYNYSRKRATEILPSMCKEDLEEMRKSFDIGGL